ncbi:MAG: winged helix-turn-helix domain-containing protein [Phycisphaera sp.]|nr:winged helix-turn-helix domain-containing protein [Phycisphaera sp.]
MNHNHRNTDPPTSVLAGQEAEANGSAQRHRAICFDTVMDTPGLTAREIEHHLGIKAHKRLPELRRAGMVRNGKSRTCTVSGKQALTWHPNVGNPCAGELA